MPAPLRNPFPFPNIFFFNLFVFIISIFFSTCYSIDEQGQALLTWKNSLNFSTTTDALQSWNASDRRPCSWFGIHCNMNGQVEKIILKSIDLQGSLPWNFQPLKFLNTLVISSANLTGTIPKEFGDYLNLVLIDVSDNSISGEIPVEICRLTKLQKLSLDANFLKGNIPLDIGNLSSLNHLTLFDNQLNGEIPKSIGKLRNLELFRAGGNQNLKGELPSEIGNCTNLVVLGIAETSISRDPAIVYWDAEKASDHSNLCIFAFRSNSR
ncbi:putative LRR receptor-like serine/threonine-protein kinase [Abeliophyllum distichum]|uniref:LRR receptor-like serine/threonine-protein kinase n=1 Tax=Abeliophyllum distichum TaxID=126358 RepID=A0ABD1QJL5_9LAMI